MLSNFTMDSVLSDGKNNRSSGIKTSKRWLRFQTFKERGMGLIPDLGAEIPHAAQGGQKIKINQ